MSRLEGITSFPVVLFIVFLCTVCLLFKLLTRTKSSLAHIPGPRPLPFLGNVLLLAGPSEKVWLPLMRSLKEEFGNVVLLYIGSNPMVFLLEAEGFEKILSSSRNISKGFQYQYIWPWLGQGLLTSTGAKWQKHRKLITPTFHFRILEDFLEIMIDQTDVLLEKLEELVGKAVDIYPLISHCSLDIICETAMGTKVEAQTDTNSPYVSAVYNSLSLVFKRMISPWLYSDMLYSWTKDGKEWHSNLETLQGFTMRVIAARKSELKNGLHDEVHDSDVGIKKRVAFLDLLINVSEEGAVLTDEDIQNEVDTFMFEGHDTTAASNAVTLYLIALDRSVQKKCQDELDDIFGDSTRPPTSADLVRMRYLTACIKESLRLYGSVPAIARVTAEDMEIDDHLIPANTEVSLPIMLLHRDPKYFPDPEKFDPDRFFGDQDVARHPYAYTPFSAGPRNCIGQKFAMMEEKVILSSILRRFNMRAEVEMKDMLIVPELVIKPKNGYHITLEHRRMIKGTSEPI